jgi:hypothetical protein
LRPLAAIVCVLIFATPTASAQDVGRLADTLAKDVCAANGAETTLQDNIATVGATPSEIVDALNVIVADTSACAPLRDAARKLAGSVALRRSPTAEDRAAAASGKIVADTLAEAERRVATMKFEVGPPPPRLTRGRSPDP